MHILSYTFRTHNSGFKSSSRLCKFAESGVSSCLTGEICAVVGNDGPSHFDSIGYGLMSIFQAISLDEQYVVMMRAMQGEPDLVAASLIFFLVATFFCRSLFRIPCLATLNHVQMP